MYKISINYQCIHVVYLYYSYGMQKKKKKILCRKGIFLSNIIPIKRKLMLFNVTQNVFLSWELFVDYSSQF